MKTQDQEHQAQIAVLLQNYRASGLTRTEFCRRIGIPVSTLDYYRRREGQRHRPSNQQQLIRVEVEAPQQGPAQSRFTIILTNGRRIETPSQFDEAALTRLIRIAEAVV